MPRSMGLVKYTTEEVLDYHRDNFGGGGKSEMMSKVPVRGAKDLTLAYTPGVADVCRATERDPAKIHENYDYIHCMNYWTYETGLVLRGDALESILTKQLAYKGSLYPLCSIFRARKSWP